MALQALRNPHASEEVIKLIMAARHLLSAYEVRRDFAAHSKTPEVQALRFVSGLYWRDLARVSTDVRVRPSVRRQAEIQLATRLPSLALGERIALGRTAGPALIQELRKDGNPRMVRALLENPRMTEGLLMPLVSSPSTAASVLELVAQHRRWGLSYNIRTALARNRSTPTQTAIHLLAGLKKTDLKAVANDQSLQAPVRQRARLRLGLS